MNSLDYHDFFIKIANQNIINKLYEVFKMKVFKDYVLMIPLQIRQKFPLELENNQIIYQKPVEQKNSELNGEIILNSFRKPIEKNGNVKKKFLSKKETYKNKNNHEKMDEKSEVEDNVEYNEMNHQ